MEYLYIDIEIFLSKHIFSLKNKCGASVSHAIEVFFTRKHQKVNKNVSLEKYNVK